MIVLFTDFGTNGPYLGQVELALRRDYRDARIVNLLAEAPAFRPHAAAHLLAAYLPEVPRGAVVLGVVDPGVGTTEREPMVAEVDGRWLVGPGNGLFTIAARRASEARWWRITWRPEHLSATFHGRDLFAPVAARIARGDPVPGEPCAPDERPDWPDDLPEVVYVDPFGNCMTGLRAAELPEGAELAVGGKRLRAVRTFGEMPAGAAFWYANANGLVEVALNRGSAARVLGLQIGDRVALSLDHRRRNRK